MKRHSISLVLAILAVAVAADVTFAQRRGGGGGGGRGGNEGFRAPAGGGNAGGAAGNAGNAGAVNRGGQQSFTNRNFSGANGAGGAQAHTSYYRGNNANFNRNNSAFFGNNGAFGNNAGIGNRNFNNYGGYGGYGIGGYGGFGGYGLGYGGGGFLPFLGGLGLGYGLGGGLGGFGGGYGGGFGGGFGGGGGGGYGAGYAANGVNNNQPAATAPANQTADDTQANPPTSMGTDYVALGESDFRAGKYPEAIGAFRHALVDEPNNAGLMMMIAQSLFQTGKWTQAAAATELAMGALPEDKWGTVVQNHAQLYGNVGDYTSQLKALEAAVKQKPDDPAMRFLLGFQYGYLNYPEQAVTQLDKAVELEGRDPAARRLHDVFAAKTGASQVGPVQNAEKPAAGNPGTKTSNLLPPAGELQRVTAG